MVEKIERNSMGGITINIGEGGGQIVLTKVEVREIIMVYFNGE